MGATGTDKPRKPCFDVASTPLPSLLLDVLSGRPPSPALCSHDGRIQHRDAIWGVGEVLTSGFSAHAHSCAFPSFACTVSCAGRPPGAHQTCECAEVEVAEKEEWFDDDEPVPPPTGTLCLPRLVKPVADMTAEELRMYYDAVLGFAEAWDAV